MHLHITVHSCGAAGQVKVPDETIRTLGRDNTWVRHMQRLCTLGPFSCPQGLSASYHKKYVSPGFLVLCACMDRIIRSVCLPRLFW